MSHNIYVILPIPDGHILDDDIWPPRHLTIAWFGNEKLFSEYQAEQIELETIDFARKYGPIYGTIYEWTSFANGTVNVGLFKSEGLLEMRRDFVDILAKQGIHADTTYPYVPHVTYPEKLELPIEITFKEICFVSPSLIGYYELGNVS